MPGNPIQIFYFYAIVSNAGLYCRSNVIVKILVMVRHFFVDVLSILAHLEKESGTNGVVPTKEKA
jgi:hypothetical protein